MQKQVVEGSGLKMLRRRLTARLPCVTGPADTQPLGNRLGLGTPAGPPATTWGPPGPSPGRLHRVESTRRSCSFSAPEPAAATDPDRLKAGCKAGTSAPPQLAAAGANKGIPFLSGCEAEPPPASTHCRDGGWSVGCKLQEDPLAAQPCNAFLFVSSLLLFLLFLLPPLPTKDQTGSPCISNH